MPPSPPPPPLPHGTHQLARSTGTTRSTRLTHTVSRDSAVEGVRLSFFRGPRSRRAARRRAVISRTWATISVDAREKRTVSRARTRDAQKKIQQAHDGKLRTRTRQHDVASRNTRATRHRSAGLGPVRRRWRRQAANARSFSRIFPPYFGIIRSSTYVYDA